MKITNWRRKLAATLVASGLISPGAAYAANLNVNLVPDPQFDMLTDPPVQCCFGSKFQLESWNDGTQRAFAYDNTATFYDSGGPLAGGGIHYFSSGVYGLSGTDPDITLPGQVSENIDVSTGATLTQIDSGEAAVRMSAFFTSYGQGQSTANTEGDRGFLHVNFLNAASASLGTAEVSRRQPQVNGWDQNSGAFPVPVGTKTLKVSLYGRAASTGPDAYIDVVDVQVREARDELLFLEVNTTNGTSRIRNLSGETFRLDYYEITSASSALRANTWTSLQDQNLPGFPAGNGSGNGWEENGLSNNGRIGESNLAGSSTVADGASVNLGPAVNPVGAHDLVFKYGAVEAQPLAPDFDSDGDADGGDFLTWQRGFGRTTGATKPNGNADGDADVDGADFAIWANRFGDTAFGGPSKLQTGFVRYIAGPAAPVPEPATMYLAGLGVAALAAAGRRRST